MRIVEAGKNNIDGRSPIPAILEAGTRPFRPFSGCPGTTGPAWTNVFSGQAFVAGAAGPNAPGFRYGMIRRGPSPRAGHRWDHCVQGLAGHWFSAGCGRRADIFGEGLIWFGAVDISRGHAWWKILEENLSGRGPKVEAGDRGGFDRNPMASLTRAREKTSPL